MDPSPPYFPITHKEKKKSKKKIQVQVFSVNFAEFLRTPFLKTSPVASTENEHNKTKQKFSLNDSLWIVLATCQNGHVLTYFFAADKKLKWDKTKRKISYLYSFKKGNFPLEGGAIAPNVFPQLRHCISQNCILLSHLTTFIIQNICKTRINQWFMLW